MSDPSDSRLHFPETQTYALRSNHVAQTFKIQVMSPPQRRGQGGFPVVYVTDGNAVFDLFKGLSWIMQSFEQECPPYILVAIGYPGETPVAGSSLRARDLTFPGCPDFGAGAEAERHFAGVLQPEDGSVRYGGGESFQRFIAEELVPFVDSRYATNVGDRTYFGHSAGGGFGLYTLFTRPQLFRNYVISSPVLTYHGRTPGGAVYEHHDFMFERARAFFTAGGALEGIRLYISVGTEEELDPLNAHWQLTSSFHRMVALLKTLSPEGLSLMGEILVGETHATAWPIAFMHGVQAVFGRRRVSGGVYTY